jgi:cell shape-determining protein MreC
LNASSLSDDSHKAFVSISKIDTYDEARKQKLRKSKEKFEDWKTKEKLYKENNKKVPKSKNYIFLEDIKIIFAERDGINKKWCYE